MKTLLLILLLVNNSITSDVIRKAMREDLKSYARQLNLDLRIEFKPIRDIFCTRYDAWGLYRNNPQQSYYYRSCLKRYAKADYSPYKLINHAIVPAFIYNGKLAGGGFSSGQCFKNEGSFSVSVSAWLATNYIGSLIAIEHEALGHHLGASHIDGSYTMNIDAAGKRYTSISEITKSEVNKCLS